MTANRTLSRVVLLVLLLPVLAGCGWFKTKVDPVETMPVDQLYSKSREALDDGNFNKSERMYQRLIARFPFGPETEQAQLDLAYAQYKAGKPEDAISTLNRFIRTFPTHKHIDYAYYLKALVNFQKENILMERIARLDMTTREMTGVMQSFNDFADLIRRYPDSRYAPDSRQRMVHLRNLLARHEIGVGLYYLRRGAYVAAAKRGQFVIENYPQSMFSNDALALMAQSYSKLGEDKLAADTKRILAANDPEHPWLSGNWPKSKSIWRQLNPFAGD
ncbi:MAG: outer membrane protein assembly factor BamD [Lysobacterales bacterium CG17_big_fil_post_rev_8_21_14_2_50_64_11]|nr:MAG: outer membrane protein assembly factor BamD [Xanthomonadales bacterium CG17_big_fil_post_rev_8_21_14_2_50_64_11]PIX60276.1 MAG: outer membrane protein assembly factor BamD [Xanthomonadales bacterium CG_4_10_14_3_um_filter_64_11]